MFLFALQSRTFTREASSIYDHHPLDHAAFPELCKFTASTWKEIIRYMHKAIMYNSGTTKRSSVKSEIQWGNYKFSHSSFNRLCISVYNNRIIPCWTHQCSCVYKSSSSSGPSTSKYCVNTSTIAYRAWLHVVVIHSAFCKHMKIHLFLM